MFLEHCTTARLTTLLSHLSISDGSKEERSLLSLGEEQILHYSLVELGLEDLKCLIFQLSQLEAIL